MLDVVDSLAEAWIESDRFEAKGDSGEIRVGRIEQVVPTGYGHGCRGNAQDGVRRRVQPIGALFGCDRFGNDIGPSGWNIDHAHFDIVGNLYFDANVVVRNASVVDDYFHCGQHHVFGGVDRWSALPIPAAACESCACAVDQGVFAVLKTPDHHQ